MPSARPIPSCLVILASWLGLLCGSAISAQRAAAADPEHPLGVWVKRHPREDSTQPSPRMGYETSYGYHPARRLLVRYGGHNQGGGGEQNSEVWTYDLDADIWQLKEPNDAPPGVCCAQQNVFHDAAGLFLRFPAFSGSHGWQSRREIALKDSSAWTYDLDSNTWRSMRPCPEIRPHPLRGAAYDPHHQVVVLHGGEGAQHGTVVYDLLANAWHAMRPEGPAPEASLSQPGFTYDAVHRVFVLFGSQFADDPRTWVYDLRANRWRVLPVAEHPPADRTSPVLAADTRHGVVLCSVQGAEGLETWLLDVARPAWKRLDLPQPPGLAGSRNRVLLYLPDVNLFVMENRVQREELNEQQIWTFRYAESPPPAAPPGGVTVRTAPERTVVSWSPPPGGKPVGYRVERAVAPTPWQADFEPVGRTTGATTFADDRPAAAEGVTFCRVRAIDAEGNEGPPSDIARARPPVVVDLSVSVLAPGEGALRWTPPGEGADVAGYLVERADVAVYSNDEVLAVKSRYRPAAHTAVGSVRAIGPFARLTDQPVAEARYVDRTVDLAAGPRRPADPLVDRPLRADQLDPDGKPYPLAVYAYRVVAVNAAGLAGGASPWRLTIPAAVEHVFVQEADAGQTRLRWQPNREQGIRGYHVYRHDGRWDTNTITRLTPEPIAQTEFLDEQSGEATRRYEIVAVDALGQEGEPSQPVWSRREWRRFYGPYVGPWHQ